MAQARQAKVWCAAFRTLEQAQPTQIRPEIRGRVRMPLMAPRDADLKQTRLGLQIEKWH
jgi:hypothetical protein